MTANTTQAAECLSHLTAELGMDYDPNLKWGKQTVKLVFGQWRYRKEVLVDVGGNCTGFAVIEAAIGSFYEECTNDGDFEFELELEDAEGGLLICEDEENQGEDWLKDMLICAEIVAIAASA